MWHILCRPHFVEYGQKQDVGSCEVTTVNTAMYVVRIVLNHYKPTDVY